MELVKKTKEKVEKAWTLTKKVTVLLMVWGLIFSVVTIGRLGVAFDYDDTLVQSAAAFQKAFGKVSQPYTPGFWGIVNQSYDLEKPKWTVYPIAWVFRVFGFKVTVLSARPAVEADALRKEWRHLLGRGGFVFAGSDGAKAGHLVAGNFVLFFGDSDTDIEAAQKAKVFPVRIKRSRKSVFKEDYNPGRYGEFILPLSQY